MIENVFIFISQEKQWIFSGIAIALIGLIGKILIKKKPKQVTTTIVSQNNIKAGGDVIGGNKS